MGKYDPLCGYLRRQRSMELDLSFTEIERILRVMLPHGAEQVQWWNDVARSDARNVQHRAWRDAGYDAVLMVGKDRVRFKQMARRDGQGPVELPAAPTRPTPAR